MFGCRWTVRDCSVDSVIVFAFESGLELQTQKPNLVRFKVTPNRPTAMGRTYQSDLVSWTSPNRQLSSYRLQLREADWKVPLCWLGLSGGASLDNPQSSSPTSAATDIFVQCPAVSYDRRSLSQSFVALETYQNSRNLLSTRFFPLSGASTFVSGFLTWWASGPDAHRRRIDPDSPTHRLPTS